MHKIFPTLLFTATLLVAGWAFTKAEGDITWKIKSPKKIGRFTPQILGNPIAVKERKNSAVFFNGSDDALVVPAIPIQGWKKFTIEVLFKPDADGPTAPRFIHFEDSALNRGTFELRITKNNEWYLDAFLKNGKTNQGRTLIDSTKLHPANKWYWAAMTYDGSRMQSFVNGIKELEDTIDFPAMTAGKISFGARLNKVNWFKGQISEIRFHPEVLNASLLQKVPAE